MPASIHAPLLAANKDLKHTHKKHIEFDKMTILLQELLCKSNECTSHAKTLQKIMLDVNKCIKHLFTLPETNNIIYENESIAYRGNLFWNNLQMT